jgi:hypothetical protein
MRAKLFLLFVLSLVCLFSAEAQTINEAESSVVLNDKTALAAIVVENAAKSFDGKIELEILDAESKVRASAAQNVQIKSGKETYKIALPLGDLMRTAQNDIAWYRLHYRVGQTEGFASLSELIKDVFELRVAAAGYVSTGTNYRIRVRALHPFTQIPVADVKIEGKLELDLETEADEDELTIAARGETDAEGFAILDFKVPANVKIDYDGDLKITGRKNGVVREIDEDLESNEIKGSIFLTADKPIYQPGQTFNVRGLYFGADGTVAGGNELEFTIKDQDDTILYRETVKTSGFGIASIQWKIPDGAKLGVYTVEVEADDDDLYQNYINFKVSRYDLPNFSVVAAPDKSFYLPADRQAEITVAAMYLFGKPVSKGKVRVVQESERRWNYKEQKYDVQEEQTVEGETDADGKYVAKVDLSKDFEELRSSSWQRFEDIHFAAYFTDSTTNRTEQRRFDVRLSKEAIHVYLVGNRYYQHQNLPVSAYVSAFYADGRPAICDVEVKGKATYDGGEFKLLQRLKTNSLGAGKLDFFRPKFDSSKDDLEIIMTARDRDGLTGSFEEQINFDDDDQIKIKLEKTIFKPGESVRINILSSKKDGFVYVDVVKRYESVLESRLVKLVNGRADVKIPYNPSFKGDLIVAAYCDNQSGYYSTEERDSRGIIFPTQQNLRLDAQFSAATYKPNEEGKINFSVADGAGKSIESALGVVIFDKAIEERAKTDAEFGSYFGIFGRLLGYDRSFGRLSLKDLNELDLSKPVSAEMQLAAEVMLADSAYYPRIYHSRFNATEAQNVYGGFFKTQLEPLENKLKNQFDKNYAYPFDDASLRKILSENGINLDAVRDPWGKNYYAVFTTEKTQNILTLRTAGADKTIGTNDDFNVLTTTFAYFTPAGKAIDKAVENYHRQTGGYIRDLPTLSAELAQQDIDLSKIKDRWARDYRIDFKVSGRKYLIVFRSYGANGYYQPNDWNTDDFDVWKSEIDYFTETENRINKVFSETVNAGKKSFPASELEFTQGLKEKGVDFQEIRDGFGEPAYVVFTKFSRYEDKTKVVNGKQTITPVTEEVAVFTIRSKGADRVYSSDDFDLTTLSGVIAEQSKDTGHSSSSVKTVTFSGANGAIRGTVFDMNGAVVPNAKVTAANEENAAAIYSVETSEEGAFLLENLPSGRYKVSVSSSGFKEAVYSNILVRSQNLVEMKVTLEVGAAQTTVDVSSDASVTVNSSDTKIETNITKQTIGNLPKGTQFSSLLKIKPKENAVTEKEENSTPRLREYFPETLLWQPEVITDKNGKAEMKFKLADNITTWKLYTIASTKNGKIGIAEKEITAFQPFFVDLEPPKFLTNGDEISLPVQIRNYTESKQKVNVSMANGDWFSFLNQASQQIEVAANASENAIFGFKAISAIKNGKQKVTAIAPKDSDAIEKAVTVRPNGQEIVKTDSQFFRETAAFDVNFPNNVLPKTQRAEMKIYPNLFSHVAESVEGLLQRPYGCGEQTTSSTYPNLMILKFTKGETKLRQTAQKYLQKGYERLLGYQVADGGFSYWGGKDESNVALTAYVLRFLNDAKGFINVDEEVVKRARNWLIGQQKADGSWSKKYYWETTDDASRTKLFTSYVARTLAMQKAETRAKAVAENPAKAENTDAALQKALAYLKTRNAEIDEPYALALYGLASLDAGNMETAREIAGKLEKMAIPEGNAVYWKLETNTPFYGWGTAGRVETTALVLQLLIREAQTQQLENAERDSLISKATLFLLKNKDRYGVWYSTQTTINVLDAFLVSLGENPKSETQNLQIFLNGAILQNVSISPDKIEPIILDLTDKLSPNANRLEIKNPANSTVMAQVVAAHYIDWRDSDVSNQNENASRLLRLDYKCDKTDAKIMDEISCAVEAERVGFKGYGMLLAEIGLPPGADVSRESLEKALEADWSLSRYDILPDRIVLYMWSKAGGTKFNFKFRPRYGISAQTPASTVYDYYNEEAKAIIAPLKFEVK